MSRKFAALLERVKELERRVSVLEDEDENAGDGASLWEGSREAFKELLTKNGEYEGLIEDEEVTDDDA